VALRPGKGLVAAGVVALSGAVSVGAVVLHSAWSSSSRRNTSYQAQTVLLAVTLKQALNGQCRCAGILRAAAFAVHTACQC
jgi:hypothetical protein